MKRGFPVFFVVLLAVAAVAGVGFTGRAVRVTEGDTIEVLRGGRAARVGLFGVVCPELGQPYGRRAREFTSDLVLGKQVQVLQKDVDLNGRVLAEVILPDGRSLNREIVRAGMGWWFRRHVPADRDLERLETEARIARRGLWADLAPTPPWEWNTGRGIR